jgi:flagellar hook-basal body complex protein FliE
MINAISLVGSTFGPAALDSVQLAGKSAVTTAGNAVGDFTQMLTQVASDTVNDLRGGEATAISGLHGKATTQEVVEAVSKAQGSLQTALAVRDKAVSAYQEITRMSI